MMEESRSGSNDVEPHAFGKYQLIAELGHGGMAEVFLALVAGPAGFTKLVVVKRLRPHLAEEPEVLEMFLDEARLAARLNHPNVVQINEVGQAGDRYFIAMEYLEGQPLNRIVQRLRRSGGLPLAMHVRIIADALAGLHHAHELTEYDGAPLCLVHRDVSPHNIVVTYDGVVKLVDFGVAKAQISLVETSAGTIKGKATYMAPEQARGERVDRRADIFSVGVMLWEAATGRRMWSGMSHVTVLQHLLTSAIPTARSVQPDIPEALDAIIQKALAHERDDRYATAAELQMALEQWLESAGARPHAREIGGAVDAAFAAERAAIRRVVDERRRERPGLGSSAAALPILDPPTATTSAPATLRAGAGGAAAASLLLGAALATVLVWLSPQRPAAATPLVAQTATSATAEQRAPRVETPISQIELRVAASPSQATLHLDGALLSGNPTSVVLPKDALTHELRVEAAGYAPRIATISLDRDRSIDVVLVREGIDERPASATAPPDLGRHTEAKRPQRRLDSANPYVR